MIKSIPFVIIQPGKQKSADLAKAVLAGAGDGMVVTGDVDIETIPESMTPVVIGLHSTIAATMTALHMAQRPYVTIDNGYLKPYREGGYFRATVNGTQLHWLDKAAPPADADRFRALGIELQPYRLTGEHVLCALQSRMWYEMLGYQPTWGETLAEIVAERTARRVIARVKPLKGVVQPSLEEHFENCWAVASLSSNVMVKAAIAGIPIFPQSYCAVSPLTAGSVFQLDTPERERPEVLREMVFHTLAAHQWTIDEIAAGRMWRDLLNRPHQSNQYLA
jgi:hypothetical protein